MFAQFKWDNPNWQAQMDIFQDIHQLDTQAEKTYLQQQWELDRLFEVFQLLLRVCLTLVYSNKYTSNFQKGCDAQYSTNYLRVQ
jgi:hypothetical protein